MTKSPTYPRSSAYEIRVSGLLDPAWAERLGASTLLHETGGTTLLCVDAADQAALHGLLQRVRDLSVQLISVTHVPTDQPK